MRKDTQVEYPRRATDRHPRKNCSTLTGVPAEAKRYLRVQAPKENMQDKIEVENASQIEKGLKFQEKFWRRSGVAT